MLPRKYNFHGYNILIWSLFFICPSEKLLYLLFPWPGFVFSFWQLQNQNANVQQNILISNWIHLKRKNCWKFDHNINNSVLTQNGSKANILNNRAVFVRAAFTLTVFARSNIISPTYPETISDIYNVESGFFLSYKSISMDYHSQIIS